MIATPRSVQEPNMPLPRPAFKGALLKAFREFELSEEESPISLHGACSKPLSAPNSAVSVLSGLTVC